MKHHSMFLITLLLFTSISLAEMYSPPGTEEIIRGPVARPDYSLSAFDIDTRNRVHRVGAMWMNITNFGYFGNSSVSSTSPPPDEDPEYPGTWAPQCEFPGGSEVQYLYQGALWLGAIIQEEGYEYPRVSTGTEGWILPRIREFYPGEAPQPIVERSPRQNAYNRLGEYITSEDAVSEQDFIIEYADTLTESFWVETDPADGPHIPLGIKVKQTSYSWSYAYAKDFIIIDWEIENIADNYLKNLYVGLYIDADVGSIFEQTRGGLLEGHTDDICGFQRYYYYETADGTIDSSVINTAYIADNDGRLAEVSGGNDFVTPHVTGVRVVRAPNPRLRTSFNWWISNQDDELDFGPAWEDDASPGNWTGLLGTPLGDVNKYFILGNREFDYDQIYVDNQEWIDANPQETTNPATGEFETHSWREVDTDEAANIADGFDTRYLLSWGPLGIFDHVNEAGERVYRLNPGEKFSMTIAYVGGENFHDRNHPQPTNTNIDPNLFDFADFRYNADWAAKVYDNPMIDTNGDGWFGEDTGIDQLYAAEIGDSVIIDGQFHGIYPGPDEGELDSRLQPEEDVNTLKPDRYDYTNNNGMLDHGDGEPDFRGPPPPATPVVTHLSDESDVVLTWEKYPSEDPENLDPFSRLLDFEGYRLYVSSTGLEADYSFIAEFDRIDYAYFSPNDSMMTIPVTDKTGLPTDSTFDAGSSNEITATLKDVGPNVGLDAIWNEAEQRYEYVFPNAHPLMPRWYSVTAFDYGDPNSGTPSLESSKTSSAIFIAPSGNPKRKPMVVPNPYRADQDYTVIHGDGLAWENRDDGTTQYFPQLDRRMYFYNLPEKCLVRIFTVSGDLVQILPHNVAGDQNAFVALDYGEAWDLNSRNNQQVTSGLYLFTVEDMTEKNKGDLQSGKFVIIR
ncbi:hypothetical protein K8I28_05665 [bacterium]|nr:hypothetical protein [bacterium]